jgi:hypothetical protein
MMIGKNVTGNIRGLLQCTFQTFAGVDARSSQETEKNLEKPESRHPVSRLRFETRTSQVTTNEQGRG